MVNFIIINIIIVKSQPIMNNTSMFHIKKQITYIITQVLLFGINK